jgi:hypothetical protein
MNLKITSSSFGLMKRHAVWYALPRNQVGLSYEDESGMQTWRESLDLVIWTPYIQLVMCATCLIVSSTSPASLFT